MGSTDQVLITPSQSDGVFCFLGPDLLLVFSFSHYKGSDQNSIG
jgi:hypothetical protein